MVAITGCSNSPSSPSPSALNGTKRIFSIQMATQTSQVFLPPEVPYQVTFDGSRVSARINCNTCNGSFTTSGSSVSLGPVLACTRAACVAPAYEAPDSDVLSLLAGSHEVSESFAQITLRSSRGIMILRPQ
jgi:heat shock protein HslJ